jgi:5-formyltetrahydrofolate cyclo-ligase
VPGVLFDRRGFRIGRGGGYYDRFLAALAGGVRIGLIYDEFLVDRVPTEDHDVPVDAVITPSGLHPRREP